jgi:hypothetical protein
VALRSWLVIPIAGSLASAIALMTQRAPAVAIVIGVAAAAVTGATRMLAGHSPASLAGGVVAAGLVAFGVGDGRSALAIAMACFAIIELGRETPRARWPAIAAAFVAAVLDPSFVALAPVAGWQLSRGPRWTWMVPVAGIVMVVVAALAAIDVPSLWRVWAGHDAARGLAVTIGAIGDSLGAIVSVAALAGLVLLPRRGVVVIALAVTAIIVDARTGHLGGATVGIAALAAGVAVSRLAAMIRVPVGQAFAGATAGFIVVASLAVQVF